MKNSDVNLKFKNITQRLSDIAGNQHPLKTQWKLWEELVYDYLESIRPQQGVQHVKN